MDGFYVWARRAASRVIRLTVVCMVVSVAAAQKPHSLKAEDLFPSARLLDVQVTMAEGDWEQLRQQRRSFITALAASRQFKPVSSPYTYVPATVTIDGTVFSDVAIRKKGFIGSQSRSRPSFKIKLNATNSEASIDGVTHLTLNNNKQDTSLMSQFLAYRLFRVAGSPAPRCALAKVTVNGESLGVYSHVESIKRPMIQRLFGNDRGTLYEGTAVDFYKDWHMSFERKFGSEKSGRAKIESLIDACGDGEVTELVGADASGTAHVPTSARVDRVWMKRSFDDSNWRKGSGGAGHADKGEHGHYIDDSFDFAQQLKGKASSLYLRFPFKVDSLKIIRSMRDLILRVQYDDGFIAYLNGVRVASANAPDAAAWDSVARKERDNSDVNPSSSFSLAPYKKLLRRGRNVLALHALNSEASDSDLLISATLWSGTHDHANAIADHVDMDSFYKFWALEGLMGFWDGYSGNNNNFFIYLNPDSDRFHFLPWGADALFEKFSRLEFDPESPLSVKVNSLIAYRLYQTEEGRARYARSLREILKKHWNEKRLLQETDRLEAMVEPHLVERQSEMRESLRKIRAFIRNRKSELLEEIANGMPIWNLPPSPPFVMPAAFAQRGDDSKALYSLWDAARLGDLPAIRRHLAAGVDVNAKEPRGGTPPLSMAALGGQPHAVRFLLESGAKVNASNFEKQTALHGAAFLGRVASVRVLLEYKANVRFKNDKGETPLDAAAVPWSEPLSDIIIFIADLIQVKIDLKTVEGNRSRVARLLKASLSK